MFEDEDHQKAKLEEDLEMLQSQLLQISFEADEVSRLFGLKHSKMALKYIIFS